MEKELEVIDIVSEWMIIRDMLGITRPKSGRSRIVSSWIKQGLKYIEVSGYRFFSREDLADFFKGKYEDVAK